MAGNVTCSTLALCISQGFSYLIFQGTPHLLPYMFPIAQSWPKLQQNLNGPLLHDIDIPLYQHTVFRAIDKASFDALLNSSLDILSRALALSCAILHAGDWLNVVPSSVLGLHLLDDEFRLCL